MESIVNYLEIMYGKDKILFYVFSIAFIIFCIAIVFVFIRVIVHAVFKLICKIKQSILYYGEDKISTKTAKKIGNYNFLRLIYYEYIDQKILRKIREIYYPSTFATFFYFSGLLFFYWITYQLLKITFITKLLQSVDKSDVNSLHGVLGSIIFAFLISISETFRSGEKEARVIFKESLIFVSSILLIINILLSFLFNHQIGFVAAWLIGILVAYSIYSLIKSFLNSKYVFQEKVNQLTNDRFAARLDRAVKDRIYTNTLLKYFEKSEYAIDYSYFRPSKENVKTISLSKNGIFRDVYLNRLENLLQEIEKEANQIGLSIKKVPQKERRAATITGTISGQIENIFTPVQISVLKIIGNPIENDRMEIIAIPKSLFEIQRLKNIIQDSIMSIFIVELEDSVEKEMRLELDDTKDKALSAIEESKVGVLGSVMEIYVELIRKFLNVFQTYGGGYTSESAKKERNSILGGWSYVRWIREDLFDILSESIRSEKDKVVKEVIYIPMKILYEAFIKRDHLIFQEFISFQSYIYWESQNIKDEKLSKFITDRITRYLVEFADYRITPDLEDPELKTEDIKQIKDFIFEILQGYKNLLKHTFDKKDVVNFKRYLNDSQSILQRFKPTEESRKIEIELELQAQNISDKQKKELEMELEKTTLFEKVERDIRNKKKELIFGFASWCLFKLKESNFENRELLAIWNDLLPKLPTKVEDLIKIYESTYRHSAQDFWGWDWWELEEKHQDDGGLMMGEINFDAKVHNLFALLLLKAVKGKSIEQIDINNISISRDSKFYFENETSFAKSSLISMSDNQKAWEKVLTPEESQSKQIALDILTKLVEKQGKEEELELSKKHIDSKKVTEFIDNFIEAYQKDLCLRRILTLFNMVKNTKLISKSKRYWGFNEIYNKEPFLSSWYVDYGDFGEHYGRGLSDSEDLVIFGQIRSNSTSIGGANSLNEAVNTAIKQLKTNGFVPSVIFTTFHLGEWRRATLSDTEFIPSWQVKEKRFNGIPNFIGVYKKGRTRIPIFRIWVNESKHDVSEVIVVDMLNFIKLKQYSPLSKSSEKGEMEVRDNFAFKVTDLSEESKSSLRNDLISKDPTWLQKIENKEQYLKQKVIIHVKEKFDLDIVNKKASVKATIKQDK